MLTSGGHRSRLWSGLSAVRAGKEVSQCGPRPGLAIRLPVSPTLQRSTQRGHQKTPCTRSHVCEGIQKGDFKHRDHQTRRTAHPPSLLRNASSGRRGRYPYRPRTVRAQGCANDHDLHPRHEPPRNRRHQSFRPVKAPRQESVDLEHRNQSTENQCANPRPWMH